MDPILFAKSESVSFLYAAYPTPPTAKREPTRVKPPPPPPPADDPGEDFFASDAADDNSLLPPRAVFVRTCGLTKANRIMVQRKGRRKKYDAKDKVSLPPDCLKEVICDDSVQTKCGDRILTVDGDAQSHHLQLSGEKNDTWMVRCQWEAKEKVSTSFEEILLFSKVTAERMKGGVSACVSRH